MKKLLTGLLILIIAAIVVFFAPAVMKPTLTHESRVLISKTPKDVWKKFSDSNSMGKWIDGFKSIEIISGEPNTVGSKYKIVIEENGEHFEAIETVKEIVENEKIAFRLSGDMLTDDVVITLVNKGLSTEFIQTETLQANDFFYKALFYWMHSSLSEESQKNLNNLKKFVEEG